MKQPFLGSQFPLEFGCCDTVDFEHFIEGANTEACSSCRTIALGATSQNIYLWGPVASGKSHLLQSTCHLAQQHDLKIAYVPLNQYAEFSPKMLEGLELLDIVCVDDIDCIAGQDLWEQALLHLYNRLRDRKKPLLMTGSEGPRDLALQLCDLKSRIGWGLTYHMQMLADKDKIVLLQKRAHTRNFTIPEEVVAYLIRHVKRDVPSLLALLDKLDQATLTEQRKLSIPFVKTLL